MTKFKKPLCFALCLLPVAIVAGIFVCIYQLDIYPDDILAPAIDELGSVEVLIAIATLQTVGYVLFCGFFGYILSDRLGLWVPMRFETKRVAATLVISLIGGILFSLDYWVFGHWIDGIRSAQETSLTVSSVIASVLYGGIIEEVMLRLFFMSLIAFGVQKLFFKAHDKDSVPTVVFVIANIVAAILFAAGHLPATILTFGGLTPLLVLRCFLLNGGFGLVFGYLYRRHGIHYAMMGHALFHIVSKLIWFICI